MNRYVLLALALLAGCSSNPSAVTDVGLTAQPKDASDPCAVAARERERAITLRAEGRLGRSLRVLDHADTLCPKDAKESASARAAVLTELQSSESPEALIELAQRATTLAEAQRSYDRALAAIEREGGRVEVGTVVDPHAATTTLDTLELDRDGGRLAILHGNEVSIRDRRVDYRETHRILRDAWIWTAAFSNVDTIAVATDSGETTLWSLSSGEQLQTLHTAGWHAHLAFSPDGRVLGATSHGATELVLYDTANANILLRLECTGGFAFMPDGRTVVALNKNELRAYDVSTGKRQWGVDGANVADSESRVSVSPDGQRVRFAAGYAHIASVDVKSKKRVALTWESSVPDIPRVLALSPDGAHAFFGDSTGPIPGGLHAVTERSPRDLQVDVDDAETATFSGDSRALAFAAESKVHIVDVSDGRSLAVLESVYARPIDVALSFAGNHLAIAGSDDAAWVFSADGEPPFRRLSVGMLGSIAISADGRELAGTREEPKREVALFDARGADKETLSTVYQPTDIAFSPIDGRVLVSVSTPTATATSGSRFLEIPIPARTWSRDRSQLALTSPHNAQIGDQKGTLITTLTPRDGDLRATAFTPSNLLAMGLSNGMVVSTGKLQLKAHDRAVGALAFASEERMASSSADGTVKIWDLTDARNQPKVYHLPDVREIDGSAGLFAWTTQDARVHLFHIATNRRATLVAARGAESAAIHIGDAVELLGADADSAARGLVCRVGQRTYAFALCRERFLTPGLLRAILAGTSLDFDP